MDFQPLPEENQALRTLVEELLIKGQDGIDKDLKVKAGIWATNFHAGTFVTGFKDKSKPLDNANVWCCMSNGEYDGLRTVWDNLIDSISICQRSDPRRFEANGLIKNPQTYEISILSPKSRWTLIEQKNNLWNIECSRHRAIALIADGNLAIFLPSVWEEESSWTSTDIISHLIEKATGTHSASHIQVYEIDVYTILPTSIINNGLLSGSSNSESCSLSSNQNVQSNTRNATHAGSWYDSAPNSLRGKIEQWLQTCKSNTENTANIIIAPHAGYSYSGPIAACSYAHINPKTIKRVFILGPSHFYSTSKCELTAYEYYNTPFGTLKIDTDIVNKFRTTGLFNIMTSEVDLKEHSIEMQLPFIKHLLPDANIIPILVGAVPPQQYATLLVPYLEDSSNLFVISTDFSHWGPNYNYYFYDNRYDDIWQSIQAFDMEAVKYIINQDFDGFETFLFKYKNTICGRYCISILLYILKLSRSEYDLHLLKYSQSNKVTTPDQNSVSYVAMAGSIKKTLPLPEYI